MTVSEKICHVCGIDVHDQRRTRDTRGRYFCKPCWNALLSEYYRRHGEMPPKPPSVRANPSNRARKPSRPARANGSQRGSGATPVVVTAGGAAPVAAASAAAQPYVWNADLARPNDAPAPESVEAASPCLSEAKRATHAPFRSHLIPFALFLPAALLFATQPNLRLIGAAGTIAALGVVALAYLCLNRSTRQPPWAMEISSSITESVRDLIRLGGLVMFFVGLAVIGVGVAWRGAGAGGSLLVALPFLMSACRIVSRLDILAANASARPGAAADAANPGEKSSTAPTTASAPAGDATGDSLALAMRPAAALQPAELPQCKPILPAARKSSRPFLSWRGHATLRTSDLLGMLGTGRTAADDEAEAIEAERAAQREETLEATEPEPPAPIRLRVDVRPVRATRRGSEFDVEQPEDPSSDSSVSGFTSGASIQTFDTQKRAWA
jgi:hypothetical protein